MPKQLPKINTNWLILLAAIGLGVGAVYMSNSLIRQRLADVEAAAKRGQETVDVVVAKRDLVPGDALTSDVVAVRRIPKQFAHEGGLRPQQFDAFENQRVVTPVKRGEELLAIQTEGNGSNIFSNQVKKGYRALTFEVDEVNSISGMLRPGDRIDLIYTSKGAANGQDVTVPLLSNVPVLATDQSLTRRDDGTGKQRTFTTITLEVSPFDADRIIVAKSAGQLTAVLRHPDDGTANQTRLLTASALLPSSRMNGGLVQYIVGGSGTGTAEIQTEPLAPSLGQLAQAVSLPSPAH
jgi:pilus assembly protein CpaB